jgi:hypothetical protein
MLVETKRTQPTQLQFAKSLLSVVELSKAAAGVFWAHFAGETGDGYHCYGHNLGNVKWTQGCGLDYHALNGVWEGFPPATAAALIARGEARPDPSADHAKAVGAPTKQSVIFTSAHPMSWFRDYPSLDIGMRTFVESKRSGRYATAWDYLLRGDAEGYARELGRLKYYTASPDAYAASMKAKHQVWMQSRAYDEARDESVCIDGRCIDIGQLEETTHPAVDFVTGEPLLMVDFAVIHPNVEWPSRPPIEV